MQILPHDGEQSTVVLYACCMVFFGLIKSWAAPACNNPIFAEVVPAHLRTLVYSFDRYSFSSQERGEYMLVYNQRRKMERKVTEFGTTDVESNFFGTF